MVHLHPAAAGADLSEAEVDPSLEFPENIYTPHDGWDQLQILARLSSPDREDGRFVFDDTLDMDGVRRSALGVARRLKLWRSRGSGSSLVNSFPASCSSS